MQEFHNKVENSSKPRFVLEFTVSRLEIGGTHTFPGNICAEARNKAYCHGSSIHRHSWILLQTNRAQKVQVFQHGGPLTHLVQEGRAAPRFSGWTACVPGALIVRERSICATPHKDTRKHRHPEACRRYPGLKIPMPRAPASYTDSVRESLNSQLPRRLKLSNDQRLVKRFIFCNSKCNSRVLSAAPKTVWLAQYFPWYSFKQLQRILQRTFTFLIFLQTTVALQSEWSQMWQTCFHWFGVGLQWYSCLKYKVSVRTLAQCISECRFTKTPVIEDTETRVQQHLVVSQGSIGFHKIQRARPN